MKHPSVSANHCTNPVSGLSTPRKNAGCKISTDSAVRPCTLGGWLARAEQLYAQHKVALGQVATSAHDEALYLLLHTLGLPLADSTLPNRPPSKRLSTAGWSTVCRRPI